MGTKDKSSQPDQPGKDPSFDEFEDAFFASGDASSFWDKEEAGPSGSGPKASPEAPAAEPGLEDTPTIQTEPDPAAVELPEAAPAPVAEPDEEPVAETPQAAEEAAFEDADTLLREPDLPPDEDSVEITPETPPAATDEEQPGEEEPEEYNPYALHADPAALSDQDTEVWKIADAEKLAIFDQETQIVQDPAALDVPSPDIAEAVTLTHAERAQVAALDAGETADVPEAPSPTYTPAADEEAWREASTSLEREAAGQAEDKDRASLLAEAARIHLTRLGDWEGAARLFEEASAAGLDAQQAPRGYADVAASKGDYERLRDLLVARADSTTGMAAAEALQDAALVERNNLKRDAAAIALLNRALEIEDDWFTLRLLRELHYRTADWTALSDVLARMASLATSTRAARVWVEQGRISESELQDLDAAAVAYERALAADPSYLEAFLAAGRLAGAREDWNGLIQLYKAEAQRAGGADAVFWLGRAARVARDADLAADEVSRLYFSAVKAGGDCPTLRHEQQAWLTQQNRVDDLKEALRSEADASTGAASALALYRLGQVQEAHGGDGEAALRTYEAALAADPSAVPAAEAVGRLLSATGNPERLLSFLSGRLTANKNPAVRAALALRMGEIAELKQGDLGAAAGHYAAALQARPGFGPALIATERVAAAAGDWSGLAAVCVQRANASSDPQDVADSLSRAGQACIQHLDQEDEGLDHLLKALRQVPDHSGSIELAVQLLGKRDRWREAADLLKSAAARTRTADAAVQFGYRAARIFVDQSEDRPAAIDCLERCRELQPGFLPALGLLGDLYALEEQWQAVHDLRREQAGLMGSGPAREWELLAAAEAIQHVQGGDPEAVAVEILDGSPGHAGALSMLESAALRSEDATRLLQIYGRMVRGGDPARAAQIGARIADLAQDVKDDGATLRALRDVIDAEGPEDRPLNALARIAVTLDRWSDAHRALEAAGESAAAEKARLLEAFSEDHDAVAFAWKSILEADPTNTEAASGLERALSRKGSREGLADVHAKLADHVPDASIRAMHALLAGHLYEHQEDRARAVEYYEKAFRIRTIPGKAFDALVRIHADAEDVAAIEALFDALPEKRESLRAQALEQAGDSDKAAAVYRGQIDALPDDVSASILLPSLVALEHCLSQAGDWPAVSECLARRADISTSEEERGTIEAKRRWILAEKLADSEEAWDFYRKLHEERPDDREVLEALARIAGARGETNLAIQFLDGLSNIAGDPEEAARYQRRVAEVHLSAGAADKAREAFLRALDHLSEDADSIDGLEKLARGAEDWHALVGVLARRVKIVDGRAQVETHREIARIWEQDIADTAVAADAWRKVLEMVPEDPDALTHLVEISRTRSEWSSLVEYGAALAPHCSAVERSALFGELGKAALEHLNREDQAITFLDRASTGEAPDIDAAVLLERIHSRRGDWARVVEAVLRQARASEGSEAAALFLKAARTRRDALHDRRGAAEIYDQVLRAEPANPEALRYRGDHLFDAGEMEQAAEVYGRLENVEQDLDLDDFDVQMEQALFFFRFGECLRELGQPEGALGRYQSALALNRSHLPTLEAIGPLYIDLCQWGEAAGVFKHILQLTSGQGDSARLARVYTNLGRVEYAQGNEDKALKRFNKALELEENDVKALTGYARILFDREDWNTLLNVYNNIIYHAQEPAEVIDAYLVKGFVLDAKMSLPDKAAQHYEKSLAFDPAQPVALLRLAELALRKQDWGQASSLADRALPLPQVEVDDILKANLHVAKVIAAQGADDDPAAIGEAAGHAVAADGTLQACLGGEVAPQDTLHDLLRERLQAHL